MMSLRRATIEDVARAAGVSRQTVSRAINGKGEISPETRRRVLTIADELGYLPSRIARSLATRSSHTIGLVVPDIANPFFAEIARGVEEEAYRMGYHVFLSNSAEDPDREWAIIRSLEEQRVAGIILCSSRLRDEQLVTLSRRYSPLVFFNRQIEESGISSLLVDDFHGAVKATRYLLERGHRKIGMLRGPERSWSGQQRLSGYRATLLEAGITPSERWIVAGFPQVDGGRSAALQLLSQSPDVTAILAYNDLVALGAVQACLQMGRSVPADCAIIGFDDIPLAALVSPALTTVRLDKNEAGRRAMRVLGRLIDQGATDAGVETLETHLIVRQSA